MRESPLESKAEIKMSVASRKQSSALKNSEIGYRHFQRTLVTNSVMGIEIFIGAWPLWRAPRRSILSFLSLSLSLSLSASKFSTLKMTLVKSVYKNHPGKMWIISLSEALGRTLNEQCG